jgi:hypothetical protein
MLTIYCLVLTIHTLIHYRMDFAGSMMPYFRPNWQNMTTYLSEHKLNYKRVLGVLPTG